VPERNRLIDLARIASMLIVGDAAGGKNLQPDPASGPGAVNSRDLGADSSHRSLTKLHELPPTTMSMPISS
jgi:hypothetical protein